MRDLVLNEQNTVTIIYKHRSIFQPAHILFSCEEKQPDTFSNDFLLDFHAVYVQRNKQMTCIYNIISCVHIHRFPHEIAHPAPFILIIHNFPIGMTCSLRCGLVVRIPGFHPGGPGSIPGTGTHFCSQVCFRLHFNRSVLWF